MRKLVNMKTLAAVATLMLVACGTDADTETTTGATTEAGTTTEGGTTAAGTTEGATTEGGTTEAGTTGGGAAVTWEGDIQPIVTLSCSGGSCHTDGGKSGGVAFDSYADVVAVRDEGCFDGDGLKVGEKMARKVAVDNDCNSRMPLTGDKLTDEQMKLFTDWVDGGLVEK